MSKAISRTLIIVIIVIVILIVAGGAYYATLAGSTTTTTKSTSSSTSSTTSMVSESSSSTSASKSSSGGPQYGGTLTIDVSTDKGAPGEPMTVQEGPITGTVQQEVYDGLTAIGYNSIPVPDLAVNWTMKSSTDYVFNLRQNVQFQDGTQFNASAVVFSLNRILNNNASVRYGQISDITKVTATSNYQVEITLNNASADFLSDLAVGVGIVSPTAVQKYGAQFGSQYAVGTGPYDFVQWVQNDHITLQANPNYWGPKPYIQTIRINVVPDASVRALQLQSGQAQIVELNPQEAQRLQGVSGYNIQIGKPNEFITISIDVDPKYTISPLLNPMVRQAINYAINRSAIVQYVLLGYGVAGIGPVPPAVQDAWNPSLAIYPAGGDINKAKALLAQAGYSKGFNVQILTASFTPDYLQVTQIVAQDLQNAGINATIDSESFSTAAGILLQGNGTWSLGFHDWGGIGILSANGIMSEFYNQNNIGTFQWNLQHIRDANLTALLGQLGQASASQVKPLSDKIQTIILNQGYGAILYYPDVLQGTTNNVQNYTIHPNPWYGYVIFNPVIGAGVWLGSSSSSAGVAPTAIIPALVMMSLLSSTTLVAFVALAYRGTWLKISRSRML